MSSRRVDATASVRRRYLGEMSAVFSEKLPICGRRLFAGKEYFSFLEHFIDFAWHTEVVRAPAPLNREASDIWKR